MTEGFLTATKKLSEALTAMSPSLSPLTRQALAEMTATLERTVEAVERLLPVLRRLLAKQTLDHQEVMRASADILTPGVGLLLLAGLIYRIQFEVDHGREFPAPR